METIKTLLRMAWIGLHFFFGGISAGVAVWLMSTHESLYVQKLNEGFEPVYINVDLLGFSLGTFGLALLIAGIYIMITGILKAYNSWNE